MISITGYEIKEKICESAGSLIYSARREQDSIPVILKVLKGDYPTPNDRTRYRREYKITSNLDADGIIRPYSIQQYKNTLIIVFEDFGANSLKQLADSRKFSLEEFLKIAIQVTVSIGQIHAAKIIHKDINPSNIVMNPETGQVKIIDFGISTILSRENPVITSPESLEGTIAYISPEQTGRMNRSVDYRTDYYSLGVTFYRLLTGRLPFENESAAKLVHAHIAKKPDPPRDIAPDIPEAVSDIIMKLLAKNAEDRYQSFQGLKADLQNCLDQLRSKGIIKPFLPGRQDITGRLQIPRKLYGRKEYIRTLTDAFEQAGTGRAKFVLVAGYSGIGKTSLVYETRRQITGCFISGKFEQYKRNIPYSAISLAFQSLIRQILAENETLLNKWKKELVSALDSDGQILTDIIPELEHLIGPGEPAKPEDTGMQNRFNTVFKKFLKVFCKEKHPLALFLDDLQWADSASLNLLKILMNDPDNRYLLIIGAYRDNEVEPTHPLMMTVDDLKNKGIEIQTITLNPLEKRHIDHLLRDAFKPLSMEISPLSWLVMDKTKGNPFFINQFLKTIYEIKLLVFDYRRSIWVWDLAEIQAYEITENVVELMVNRIRELPEDTREILKLASCLGNRFEVKTLSAICGLSLFHTARAVWPAVQAELLSPEAYSSDIRQMVTGEKTDYLLADILVKFQHDRIQQAAYALTDGREKQAVHLRVGRMLLANTRGERLDEEIFNIADHLNEGFALIADETEKIKLAELNLKAGEKARKSAAYTSALEYLVAGMKCLPENAWKDCYNLAYGLHKEQAETEFLLSRFEDSEKLIHIILANARTVLEKAEIYYLLIIEYTLVAKSDQALQAGKDALALLKMDIPTDNLEEALDIEISEINRIIGARDVESLISQSRVPSDRHRVAIKILSHLTPVIFNISGGGSLLYWAVSKMTHLSLKYGYTNESIFGLACYGALIINSSFRGFSGDYKTAFKFCNLGIRLGEKLKDKFNECRAMLIAAVYPNVYLKHLGESKDIADRTVQIGLESGNLINTSYMMMWQSCNSYYQGVALQDFFGELHKYSIFVHKIRDQLSIDVFQGETLALTDLSETARTQLMITGQEIDEDRYIKNCKQRKTMLAAAIYYIFKLHTSYLLEKYDEANKYALKAEPLLPHIFSTISMTEHNFYSSLTLAALYPRASESEKKQYLEKITANQKQMKIWADSCEENFMHKFLLVEAEIARIEDRGYETTDIFDQAIRFAFENRYIQEEALGNELAARFWMGKGKVHLAECYIKSARSLFELWGADRKASQLEKKYSVFMGTKMVRADSQKTTVIDKTLTEYIDVDAVIKASQAISSEINLETLLIRIMQIIIENAGARKGILILESENDLTVEASANTDSGIIEVLKSVPADTGTVPENIVRFVHRTGEDVILHNASEEGLFTHDPYILRHMPKSVLCIPIRYKDKISGILYLENSLAEGAFTPDRVKMMELLSSQAAISIENARFYTSLRESEEKYRSLYEGAVEGIFQITPGGTLISANPALNRILGYDESDDLTEIIGNVANVYANIEDRDKITEILSKNGEVNGFELRLRHRDGNCVWVSISAHAIKDADGKAFQFEGFLVDITERMEKEKAQREREAADAANKAKSEFLASMSHEIRTPMNSVLGFTEILKTRIEDPELSSYLESVHAGGKSLLKLINDILDLSKVEAGKLNPEYTAVSPRDIFDEMLIVFGQKIKEKGLELIIDIPPELPKALLFDEIRLRQILINLIGNAVKFTEKGYIKLSVNYRYPDDIHHSTLDFIFSVKDTGKGIPEDQLDSIFEAFYQVKEQKFSQFGGTGLGLAITSRLIEMMDGEISVTSELGKGTVFNIILKGVEVVSAEALESQRQKQIDFASIQFEKSIILIADDIEFNRKLVKCFFEDYDFTLLEAENGREAIEKARQYHPHLILLDMKMPETDGYETAGLLKKDDALKAIPVIAITASSMKKDEHLINCLCDSYLKKPVSRTDLISEIMKFLPHTITMQESAVSETAQDEEFLIPPAEMMKKLYDLAMMGDIIGIREYAVQIEQTDTEYQAFARKLQELADGFQDMQILKLVEKYYIKLET
ncbi:MAG: AAA family ATPase [Desulfobacterales bacterium]|nr:AAA family ATPase [Desulfobacterales bacterium]